jgi:hypothetical protein
VAHQGARINVTDDRNAVAFKIGLRGLTRPPVGSERRKFADDEGFDVGFAGFLVVEIGADVADVRIGQVKYSSVL